ncbi:MAG: PorP/SprF family type IX secretion system membrane protein, partial [Cyclobacteriaceae bacterium]
INSMGASLNYAWNYPVSKTFRFSMGVSPVLESRSLRLEEITFNEPDPFYNHLLGGATSQVDLSVRGGALLYSRGFYLGLSYLSIVNRPIRASEVALEEPFYRASMQTGFAFRTNPALAFKASVLAFLLMDDSFIIDYSLKAYLQDKGWVGLTYRDSGTGILMLGLNVTESINAAYSYEASFGGFQPFGGSSHELVVGFRINNLRKEESWVW